jgi:hypothetical protein
LVRPDRSGARCSRRVSALGNDPRREPELRPRPLTEIVVALQEIVGFLTLVAIGATAIELTAVGRGKTASRLQRLLVADGLLLFVW